ncbi:MAG: cytochrome P450 [Acidimicrobiales bacterium]
MSLTDLDDLTSVFVDPTAYADEERFHAACRVLRREQPVVRVESERYRPFWAVTRHADVLDVERDHEHFRNAPRPLLVPALMEARAEASGQMLRTLIHMDDPDHKAFRGITSSWFLPGRIRGLEDRIRELAVRYIDHMADLGGTCDFAQEVGVGFPLHVILSILGLPEEDFPRVLKLTTELFGSDDDEINRSGDAEAQRMAAMLDFFQYFVALTADRRAKPTDDLASVIANATIDGAPLNDFDAASYYVIIATAGHDTTSSSIAGGLEALLRHPDQLARLRDDPSLGANAVEEMIRWVTPVKEFMRTATEDRTVGDQLVPAGDSVYLAYLSANRDEAVFEDPFRFDVGRADNKQAAFGYGVHFCLGAHLARLELRVFFEELLARVDDVHLAGEPSRSATVFVGGLKHLPVTYRMR